MCGRDQRIIIFCPEIIEQIKDCIKIILVYSKFSSCVAAIKELSFFVQKLWHTPSLAPQLTLAPSTLRHKAHFGPRNTSALIILRPNAYFGPEILRPETTSAQYTSARGPNFQSPICCCCCMFHNSRLENVVL